MLFRDSDDSSSSNSSSSSEQKQPEAQPDVLERITKQFRIEVRKIKQMEISIDEKKKLIRDQIVQRKKRELAAKIAVLKKKQSLSNNKSKGI